jgi:hypothetical protein
MVWDYLVRKVSKAWRGCRSCPAPLLARRSAILQAANPTLRTIRSALRTRLQVAPSHTRIRVVALLFLHFDAHCVRRMRESLSPSRPISVFRARPLRGAFTLGRFIAGYVQLRPFFFSVYGDGELRWMALWFCICMDGSSCYRYGGSC